LNLYIVVIKLINTRKMSTDINGSIPPELTQIPPIPRAMIDKFIDEGNQLAKERLARIDGSAASAASAASATYMASDQVIFKKMRPDAQIPVRGTPHAAGFDLFAVEETLIGAGAFVAVPTGIAIQLPPGHYGQIAPRSGLAVRNGVIIGAGIIDVDYTGELLVCASTLNGVYKVAAGTKIAQLIPIKYAAVPGVEGEFAEDRPGGHAGFGSTGI
jgi:dUTP pyrophosphatase